MVTVVALANDEHNIWTGERAAVYPHLASGSHELCHLTGGQLVGIDAKCQAIDGLKEHSMIFLGERVLYIANGGGCEQLPCGRFLSRPEPVPISTKNKLP